MNTDQEMNQKIKRAFEHSTPDVFHSVLADCKEQKGARIMNKKTTPSGSWLKPIIAVAAAIVLLIGTTVGIQTYSANNAVASTVLLDVNPSVEIQINQHEHVLKVIAHNEDGKKIVGDMDLGGSDLDVAVNALIGSMLTNGYLSEIANSILVSVDGKDTEKSAALQAKLTEEINRLLQTDTFTGAVLSQTISRDDNLQTLADTNNISVGKAKLIQEILAVNPLHTFDELARLSINELNLLSTAATQPLNHVESIGSASDKAYIGRDAAKAAAFAHLGLTDTDIRCEIELDYEQGTMVYEIDFVHDGYEYDCHVNAVTGEIVKVDKDREEDYRDETPGDDDLDDDDDPNDDDSDDNATNTGTQTGENGSDRRITSEAARKAALSHAGVDAQSIRDYDSELEWENGILIYDIDFESGDYDYSYEVNALTGEIVKSDKELDDDDSTPSEPVTQRPSQNTNITDTEAKTIALNHAGVTADSIRDYNCELDEDDGIVVYEIEFESGNVDYSYEIKVDTGEIVKAEKEFDD